MAQGQSRSAIPLSNASAARLIVGVTYRYGLWYRPWLRTVTYLLFIAISVFSLVMGFYDLYKHFPYLDQVTSKTGSSQVYKDVKSVLPHHSSEYSHLI